MQQKKQFHKAHCKHVTKQGKQIATYTNVINVMPAVFCFFQYAKKSGPSTLIRSRIWPSIQNVWGPLLYLNIRLPKLQTFVKSIKISNFAESKMREDYGQQRTNNTCVEYINTVAILELEKWGGHFGAKENVGRPT